MKILPSALFASAVLAASLHAELKLPAIFSDHMVLQQKQENTVWGWDDPGTRVTVSFAGADYSATVAADGRWSVKLAAAPANGSPQVLSVRSGSARRDIQDVLIGEVWMCSGQSNMQWWLRETYTGDLESARAHGSNLRLITVPQVGTQELKTDFKGQWAIASPATARDFSAIGYLFGRYLEDILQVPVGLINNAWGGSTAEAWVRPASLAADPRFKELVAKAAERDANWLSPKGQADYEKSMANWRDAAAKAKARGEPEPPTPPNWLVGQHRPGNIFGGVLHPTLGYGIKGVIWYQGESNAGSAKQAAEYADLFPFLVEQWRKEQGQGDFPFYWVQLAGFMKAAKEPQESNWAILRESQTRTLQLPNTGQAVIFDLGDTKDIHPRNKYDVASRLVRWALVKDYGLKFAYRSPEYRSVAFDGGKATVTFETFGSPIQVIDVPEVQGFALRGEDGKWRWAKAKIIHSNQVEVWSDEVPVPVAVRYAWADNPAGNLYSLTGLPVTPFRTDGPDQPATPAK